MATVSIELATNAPSSSETLFIILDTAMPFVVSVVEIVSTIIVVRRRPKKHSTRRVTEIKLRPEDNDYACF